MTYTAAQLGLPGRMAYRNIWTGRTGQTTGVRTGLAPGASTTLVLMP
jgi:hypothetical protein